VGTGFPKRSYSNKKVERDDDSKKSHPALAVAQEAKRPDGIDAVRPFEIGLKALFYKAGLVR